MRSETNATGIVVNSPARAMPYSQSRTDGKEDPERKVGFREDFLRARQDRPNDDENDRQDPASLGNPTLGTKKLDGVFLGVRQASEIVLDESDVGIELGEVVVLWVDLLGVDVVDNPGHAERHHIPA